MTREECLRDIAGWIVRRHEECAPDAGALPPELLRKESMAKCIVCGGFLSVEECVAVFPRVSLSVCASGE
jgi:hypothetical protein